MIRLEASLRLVKGIGPQRALALKKLGYETVEDLLAHLPLRYEDRSRVAALDRLVEGDRVSVFATVRSARLIRTRRRGFTIFEARLVAGEGTAEAIWFNQPFLEKSLTEGRCGFFYGELRRPRTGPGRWIVHREFVHDGLRTGARETLDQMQVFAGAAERRLIGEIGDVHHQCFALPMASRIAAQQVDALRRMGPPI